MYIGKQYTCITDKKFVCVTFTMSAIKLSILTDQMWSNFVYTISNEIA